MCKDMLHDMVDQYELNELLFYTEKEDDPSLPYFRSVEGLSVTCRMEDVLKHFRDSDNRFLVLIGDNRKRHEMVTKMELLGGVPHFYISNKGTAKFKYSNISTRNVVIMYYSDVSCNVTVKEGAVIYAYCAIAHDSVIGEYAFMSAYSVGSRFRVGAYSMVGLHATILPGLNVGANCIIGAGAVVTRDVPDNHMAYGLPAVSKPLQNH